MLGSDPPYLQRKKKRGPIQHTFLPLVTGFSALAGDLLDNLFPLRNCSAYLLASSTVLSITSLQKKKLRKTQFFHLFCSILRSSTAHEIFPLSLLIVRVTPCIESWAASNIENYLFYQTLHLPFSGWMYIGWVFFVRLHRADKWEVTKRGRMIRCEQESSCLGLACVNMVRNCWVP
jgi:hypothetical protein